MEQQVIAWQFVGKIRDIVGLYLDLPQQALVLCLDEKTQIQALDRTQPILPCGQDKRNDVSMITSDTGRRRCLPRWT